MSMSTSLGDLGRRFGRMDGLDQAISGLFAKKALTFLGIISRSEERARAPEPEQTQSYRLNKVH
jgi:hypothetical protein